MIITYKKGKQIIEHESGHTDTYDKKDLEQVRDNLQGFADGLVSDIENLNLQISEIEKSIGS